MLQLERKVLFWSAIILLIGTLVLGFLPSINPINGIQAQNIIQLNPQQNIIPLINAAPENTIFQFATGTYYVGKLSLKHGQQFIGNGQVIFDGSRYVTNWEFDTSSNMWFSRVITNRNTIRESNLCLNSGQRCNWPEDLYVNDQFWVHVNSKASLTTGSWFLERTNSSEIVWVRQDLRSENVRLSVEPNLFSTGANGIVVDNIIVEKYASPLQASAIEIKGLRGKILNSTFRLNHAAGLEIWGEGLVENSHFVYNGQKGLGVAGVATIVRGNDISYNNQLSVDPNWDAGASKFSNTTNLLVENNTVNSNHGHGLWCDVRNVNCQIRNNSVNNNNRNGIFCEYGVSCVIEGNTLENNGWRSGDRLGDASITVLVANNSIIRNNTIYVKERGNAISVYEDSRQSDYPVLNSLVEGNRIYFLNSRGTSGYGAGVENVIFNRNVYYTNNPNYAHFFANNEKMSYNSFKNQGQESMGIILDVVMTPTPSTTHPPMIRTFTPTWSPTLSPTPVPSSTPTFVPTLTLVLTPEKKRYKITFSGEFIIEVEEIENR